MPRGKVLLVANNFPPVRGGSASVYSCLARSAAGDVVVLAPRTSYADGLPLIGWREYDLHAVHGIRRCNLLRTTLERGNRANHSRVAFWAWDVLIRLRLLGAIAWIMVTERLRTVCIGELDASGWLLPLLKLVPGLRTSAYIHGEEITIGASAVNHVRRRRALLAADAIVVVSAFTRDAVIELIGPENGDRISLIENGVDTARFTPGARTAELVRLYKLEGSFVFLSVCRLVEKKGIDNAISAFARLLREGERIKYVVVGTGPYEAELKARAVAEGAEAAVVFAGDVAEDELIDHYRLGDAFVMPNRRMPDGDTEGFGLVFLEANGCGLPVIAGRDGGSTSAVQDGVNGLVVDGHSVSAVADAMRHLLHDGTLRRRIGESGLAMARAAGWEAKTAEFIEVCTKGVTVDR